MNFNSEQAPNFTEEAAINAYKDAHGIKKQFWQVDIDELKMMRSKGLLTIPGFIYGVLKCLRKDGWWLNITPKEFMREYDIKRTTFYDTLTLLASDKDFNFEWSAKHLRVRFRTNVLEMPESTVRNSGMPESIDNSLGHSQQGELVRNSGQKSEIPDSRPKFRTVVRDSGKPTPETTAQQSVPDSYRYLTDIKHTLSDNALPNGTPLPHPTESVCVNQDLEYQEEKTNTAPCIEPEVEVVRDCSIQPISNLNLREQENSSSKPIVPAPAYDRSFGKSKYELWAEKAHPALVYGEDTPWLEVPGRVQFVRFNFAFVEWGGRRFDAALY